MASDKLVNLVRIEADIDAIGDFVALLRGEVTQNLRPYADQVIDACRSGAEFGVAWGSAAMHALRLDYCRCLSSGIHGLRSYVEASEVLLSAAEKIALGYRESDAMASAHSQDVLAALSLAQREWDARQAAMTAQNALHESAREQNRATR